MPFFSDLSPYSFLGNEDALNVGWLDAQHPYQQGAIPPSFLDRLWWLCEASVRRTRGFHLCEFCEGLSGSGDAWERRIVASRSGRELFLGTAEIRVVDDSGRVFAAPDLIYHYVEAHAYLPPQQFVEAVLSFDKPSSPSEWADRWEHG